MIDTGPMVEERRRLLLAELSASGRVVAADAAERFGVSEDTIRRDLRQLAADGLVQRVRGGALPFVSNTTSFAERATETAGAGAVAPLAARAAEYLGASSGVIVLDSGVTNLRIAEALPSGAGLTVVTSSPAIGAAASNRGSRVVMLGGVVEPSVGAAVDAAATEALRSIQAAVSVLGACALHVEVGVTTLRPDEVEFKRAVVHAGAEVLVVAAAEKLATAAPFKVAPLEAVDVLVTEDAVSDAHASDLESHGIEVLRA